VAVYLKIGGTATPLPKDIEFKFKCTLKSIFGPLSMTVGRKQRAIMYACYEQHTIRTPFDSQGCNLFYDTSNLYAGMVVRGKGSKDELWMFKLNFLKMGNLGVER